MANLLQLVNGIPKMVAAPSGDVVYTQTLVNNQTTPANITGAVVDYNNNIVFKADYGIVRYGATKSVEQGTFAGMYDPISSSWMISGAVYSGNNAGVTFYITSAGQLQYTTTNRSGDTVGTISISLKLL